MSTLKRYQLSLWNILLLLISKHLIFATVLELEPFVFPKGANTLFIGHSFFVPIARQFDVFATSSGKYPDHNLNTFLKGGESGSPVNLWENHKDEIETIFNDAARSGTPIELFGMSAGAPGTLELSIEEVMSYYTRWIDLALSYNSKISVYIGMPWLDFPADYEDADVYSSSLQQISDYVWSLVQEIRESYPDTNIFYLNYGSIAGTMRHLFEDDELIDVTHFIKQTSAGATQRTSLFVDTKGHGGSMMLDMMGLTYLYWFYGTPREELIAGATESLLWNGVNVADIFKEEYAANKDYTVFDSNVNSSSSNFCLNIILIQLIVFISIAAIV